MPVPAVSEFRVAARWLCSIKTIIISVKSQDLSSISL